MRNRSGDPMPAPGRPPARPEPREAAGRDDAPLPAGYEPSAEDWLEYELQEGYLAMKADRDEEADVPAGGAFGLPSQESDYR